MTASDTRAQHHPPYLGEYAMAQSQIMTSNSQAAEKRGELRRNIASLREALSSSVEPEHTRIKIAGGNADPVAPSQLYVHRKSISSNKTITAEVVQQACEKVLAAFPFDDEEEGVEWRSALLEKIIDSVRSQVVIKKQSVDVLPSEPPKPRGRAAAHTSSSEATMQVAAGNSNLSQVARELHEKKLALAQLDAAQNRSLGEARETVNRLQAQVEAFFLDRGESTVQLNDSRTGVGMVLKHNHAVRKPRLNLKELRRIVQAQLALFKGGSVNPAEIRDQVVDAVNAYFIDNDIEYTHLQAKHQKNQQDK